MTHMVQHAGLQRKPATLDVRRSGPCQVRREAVSASGTFDGYGSVFGAIDTYGTCMLPGCFKASLDRHAAAGTRPKGLWQHDQSAPIITWTSVAEDDYGLKLSGRFIEGVQQAAEGLVLMRAGEVDGLSIGFDEVSFVDVTPDEAVTRHGLKLTDADLAHLPESGYFRLYTEIDLWEISQVTFQSCAPAKADVVRAAGSDGRTIDPQLAAALSSRAAAVARLASVIART